MVTRKTVKKTATVTSKKKPSKASVSEAPAFDTRMLYQGILSEVAKKIGDADDVDDTEILSTGSLVHDLVIGGGITPSMMTNSGFEQSSKTTDMLHTLAEAIYADIDLIGFFDSEGSTRNSIPYLTRIIGNLGIKMSREDLFGVKDPDTGKRKGGRVYYRTVTRGKVLFNWLASVLNRAPDKVNVHGKWYLVYPKNNDTKHLADYHDPSTKRKDGIYIPAKHGGLQGIVFVDSWAALNPESKDTDEQNDGLGAKARMFSEGLPRFKGLLAAKKFAVIGSNLLSEIPMAMYGPKEKEKGGNDLRGMSDVRTRFTSRSLSSAPLYPVESKKRKGFEVEKAIGGGIDAYQYKHIKTIKNKVLASANREGWMRIWVRDKNGQGRGIDPVFDTIYYGVLTGQIRIGGKDARNKIVLNLDGHGKSKKTITWPELKLWVLGTKEDRAKICKTYGFTKPFALRTFFKRQLSNGRAEALYAAADDDASTPATDE